MNIGIVFVYLRISINNQINKKMEDVEIKTTKVAQKPTTSFKTSESVRNQLIAKAETLGITLSQLCENMANQYLTGKAENSTEPQQPAEIMLSNDSLEMIRLKAFEAVESYHLANKPNAVVEIATATQSNKEYSKSFFEGLFIEDAQDWLNNLGVEIEFFNASKGLDNLLTEINDFRKNKGLATLQKSLLEIVLHWAESLNTQDLFNKTTGMNFDEFKTKLLSLEDANEVNGKRIISQSRIGFITNQYQL